MELATDLLDLPAEIRDDIFCYCDGSDLVNMACTSKAYYHSIVYIMWCEVIIPWSHVVRKSVIMSKPLRNLKFTTSLYFYDDDVADDDNDDSHDNGTVQDLIGSYEIILKYCNPTILVKFRLDSTSHNLHNHNLIEKPCKMFYNLKFLFFNNDHPILSESNQDWWVHLSGLLSLQKLEITSCINDEDVKEIACATELKELTLIGQKESQITNKSFEYISSLSQLRKLTIFYYGLWNSNICEHLGKLINLTKLSLRYMDDEILAYICHCLINLENLYIGGTNVTNIGISHINTLTSLKTLGICNLNDITDIAMSSIKALKFLKELDVSRNSIKDNGLLHISKLVSLENLDICKTDISDVGLSYLSTLVKLKELNISENDVKDIGISYLNSLTLLEKLDVRATGISGQGLSYLSCLVNLKSLDASYNDIKDNGISYLRRSTALENLDVSSTGITDLALLYISSLVRLTELYISNNSVTDHGISHLSCLTSLKLLDILDTNVSYLGRFNLIKLSTFEGLKIYQNMSS